MSCPICSHTELEKGAESCPQCGSDLEIFNHIEKAHKADNFQKRSMLSLTAMLGIVMASWGSASLFSDSNKGPEAELAAADTTSVVVSVEDPLNLSAETTPVEEFVKKNDEVKPEVSPMVEKKEPANETAPVATAPVVKVKEKAKPVGPTFEEDGYIYHKVRNGDSFWKISKRYFGNGNRAKQIAADNDLNPKKNIPLGTKLKINK